MNPSLNPESISERVTTEFSHGHSRPVEVKRMARKAKVEIKVTEDLTSAACKEAKVEVKTSTVTLEASKSNDGKEHSITYPYPIVSNRAQALAVLNGEDTMVWRAVSEFLRIRARQAATLDLRSQFTDQTEKSVLRSAEILWNSVRTKPHAVAMISAALGVSAEVAGQKMAEFTAKRAEVSANAKAKREAAKIQK